MPPLSRRALLCHALLAPTLAAAALLAGCATPEPPRGLTPAQVAALQSQGFERTDNGWELGLPDKVLFSFDEDVITPERQLAVVRIGRVLRDAGIDRLRIDGHTDNAGSAEYNQQLSVRRAEAVARVMGACGFVREHLEVRGLGKTRPIADNGTAAGRAENRRVAIIVTVD
ncbi:OmpA family protein [Cupriavidus agavae]|uniref:Outer membrane protein OmpA-like peptidoglycan-associated protein n=1 Tax=Cupriavidus agavae TaxID=1001822 RepID=A0A4V2FHW4_9BURK|nr:OmpA family protein [Cupriavidus agavae]RZT41689.1 outer membrane protein OmpA-like peptidoglycan-associated protein [Cupriavidus agavae]